MRVSIASPHMLPSPNDRRVGIRIRTFEACSGFTRYGPSDRSAAQGDLYHEAPTQPVTRLSRSLATGSIDNYPGGTFLHCWLAPSGRTVIFDGFSGDCRLAVRLWLAARYESTP